MKSKPKNPARDRCKTGFRVGQRVTYVVNNPNSKYPLGTHRYGTVIGFGGPDRHAGELRVRLDGVKSKQPFYFHVFEILRGEVKPPKEKTRLLAGSTLHVQAENKNGKKSKLTSGPLAEKAQPPTDNPTAQLTVVTE